MTSSILPSYWLPRPAIHLDDATRMAFDELLAAAIAHGPDTPFPYPLAAPKWQFLCYIAETGGLALHGSGNPNITRFEPRQPVNLHEFGAQLAIYAASDGIWPMYFAIVDREHFPTAIVNGCIHIAAPDGSLSEPFYLFSVGKHVLHQYPYRNGMVYLLPRTGFTAEPPFPFGMVHIHSTQLASLEPVVPLAKLEIAPTDFPFLDQMRSHDDTRLAEYARVLNTGAPWPEG